MQTQIPVSCPVCSNELLVTVDGDDIDVPEGHLGCGPFSAPDAETMRASARETVADLEVPGSCCGCGALFGEETQSAFRDAAIAQLTDGAR